MFVFVVRRPEGVPIQKRPGLLGPRVQSMFVLPKKTKDSVFVVFNPKLLSISPSLSANLDLPAVTVNKRERPRSELPGYNPCAHPLTLTLSGIRTREGRARMEQVTGTGCFLSPRSRADRSLAVLP